MKQKILTMLELQNAMNRKVKLERREAGYAWYRAIWTECAEMLDHYGWKWKRFTERTVLNEKSLRADLRNSPLEWLSGWRVEICSKRLLWAFFHQIAINKK